MYVGNILESMASGKIGTAVNESYLNDVRDAEFEAMLETSSIPIATIMETACADTQSDLLLALEVFELQMCVGAAKVVSEGAEPTALLEGAVKDFFHKVIEKIKEWIAKVKAWFKKIFDKFKKKKEDKAVDEAVKAVSDNSFDKKVDEVEADAKSSEPEKAEAAKRKLGVAEGQTKMYRIKVKEGLAAATNVLNALADMFQEATEGFHDILKEMGTRLSGSVETVSDEEKEEEKALSNASSNMNSEVYGELSKKTSQTFTSQDDINKYITDAFGIGGKHEPMKQGLKAADLAPLVREIKDGKFIEKGRDAVTAIEKQGNEIIKVCKQIEDNANGAQASFITKSAQAMAAMFTMVIGMYTATVNKTVGLLEGYSNMYMNYIRRISGKTEAVKESIEYIHGYGFLYENKDVEDAPDDESGSEEKDDKPDDKDEEVSEGYAGTTIALDAYIRSYV